MKQRIPLKRNKASHVDKLNSMIKNREMKSLGIPPTNLQRRKVEVPKSWDMRRPDANQFLSASDPSKDADLQIDECLNEIREVIENEKEPEGFLKDVDMLDEEEPHRQPQPSSHRQSDSDKGIAETHKLPLSQNCRAFDRLEFFPLSNECQPNVTQEQKPHTSRPPTELVDSLLQEQYRISPFENVSLEVQPFNLEEQLMKQEAAHQNDYIDQVIKEFRIEPYSPQQLLLADPSNQETKDIQTLEHSFYTKITITSNEGSKTGVIRNLNALPNLQINQLEYYYDKTIKVREIDSYLERRNRYILKYLSRYSRLNKLDFALGLVKLNDEGKDPERKLKAYNKKWCNDPLDLNKF